MDTYRFSFSLLYHLNVLPAHKIKNYEMKHFIFHMDDLMTVSYIEITSQGILGKSPALIPTDHHSHADCVMESIPQRTGATENTGKKSGKL